MKPSLRGRFPLLWAELTDRELAILATEDPVVVLPMAALEQHGPHLPVSTDAEIAKGILTRALAELPRDLPVVILPMQLLGTSAEHAAFSGTVTLDAHTLERIVTEVASGLARHGIRRMVLFNTHGGNKHVVDAAGLRARTELGMLVVKAHSFRFPIPEGVNLPESEWRHGLHGGAVETAMMLHLRPDLIRGDQIANFSSLGLELESVLDVVGPEGSVGFAWRADDLNASGVTGNATLANPEMGRDLVDAYGQFLARVVQDAAAFPLHRLAPGA